MKICNFLFCVIILTSLEVIARHCGKNKTRKESQPLTPSIRKYLSHLLTPPNRNLTINLLIHIDIPFRKLLDDKFSRNVYLKSWKIRVIRWAKQTEKFFHRSQLYLPIVIKIKKIKFVISMQSLLNNFKRIKQHLEDYAAWQMKKKQYTYESSTMWYFSVLFSELNLSDFNKNGDPVIPRGVSYYNGFCSLIKSCAVLNYDHYIDDEMVATFAHELGHSFNAKHDKSSGCDDFGVMTAGFGNKLIPTVWTNCSRLQIEKFFYDNSSWCFSDIDKLIKDNEDEENDPRNSIVI